MKLSYEGIGQWAATFACDDLAEGELVKVSANGTVAACAAGAISQIIGLHTFANT